MNGRKRLIIGNHDVDKKGRLHPTIASLPWDRPPEKLVETNDEGQRLVLCHYALRTWQGIGKGAYHFFGHSHGDLESFSRSRDVGVDMPDVGYRAQDFPAAGRRIEA